VNTQFWSLSGIMALLTALQTTLANSKVRLFKVGFVPNSGTQRADYITNECDFDGYPAGGATLTDWQPPILGPGTGMSIGSPIVLFETDPSITVMNNVAGWWLETAGGVLQDFGMFADPIPMEVPYQGFPWSSRIAQPTGE
jgi:hypothetical protein